MRLTQLPVSLRASIVGMLRRVTAPSPAPMDGLVPAAPIVDPGTHPLDGPASTWTPARLAVEERLWGEGFMVPGGESELTRYARPLGLSSASTVLLLGTATGGPPALLARDLGVWVVGHEADPVLCQHATARIAHAGVVIAKRVSIAGFDPLAPAFRPRFCNHALVQDAVRDAPLAPLLAAIAAALKPHGQIVLTELVADQPLNPADPAIAAWARLEGRGTGLHSTTAITRGLGRLGFDVRVEEDISTRHIQLALHGWHDMVLALAKQRPSPDQAAAVVVEAELWTRRLRLMQTGQLRLVRWHAFSGAVGVPPGAPTGTLA